VTVLGHPVSSRLPDFPWDQITSYGDTARAHPDGIVDLSVGTPVDPTPEVVREALGKNNLPPGDIALLIPHLRRTAAPGDASPEPAESDLTPAAA